ncbi:MAG TPA: taurine catabolism dioxygenase TauD [Gammaproteobacteria bacterium]|nr:taurine catabolism dioxygenase TauD [Gammaproteobacteria bacterium]
MLPLKTVSPDNPFELENTAAYAAWREKKLAQHPQQAESLIVEVKDPCKLSQDEREAILECCARANMAVYKGPTGTDPDKRIPATFGAQFGLRNLDRNMGSDDDGITALQVVNSEWRGRYIPYTDRTIHWHTDGYYNALDQQIFSLLLHCVRPAESGGENAVLDHEIAYIRLRDEKPAYIEALMAPDAMTIPANVEQGVEIRPARSGPVFSVNGGRRLHMRYTARTHSIVWKQDAVTQAAVHALETLLSSDDPYIFRLTLQPGWGLISSNVLHDRSRFEDNPDRPRLLYRLRYFDRIEAGS